LGPVGSPIAPPPIPWLRATNSFPTPNSSYNSSVNTFVDPTSGITNALDDVANFSVAGLGTISIRDLSVGNLDSPISPPSAGNSAIYGATTTTTAFEYSDDGGATWNPNGGFGAAMVTITNTGSANPTVYNTEMLQLDITGGAIMLRESPTKQSLGRHTIAPDPRGYRISSFFDVFLELSFDGMDWFPADRSIRMAVGAPPAAPGSIFLSQDGTSLVLNWQNEFTLQSATDVTGPYLDVTVAGGGPVTTGPYAPPMTQSQMFFRLRQ